MNQVKNSYDYLIAGSGFAGSITALCLNSAGYTVCLIEKDEHPRFAIGESSTPVADMIMRKLSETYDLPELKKLSRYGSWQQHFPDVKCGLKRGFSYYKHEPGTPFRSDTDHCCELLVAASVNDENSDTQWYRPETDAMFVQMVKDAGIDYMDHTVIKSIKKTGPDNWILETSSGADESRYKAGFIIDATGSPDFSARFFDTSSSASDFKTNSRAIYSHLVGVPEWNSFLIENEIPTADYPYHPDHSALHHLIDEGWLWMLRFNDGLLSAGLVLDGDDHNHLSAENEWNSVVSGYPSLETLFSGSNLADPPNRYVKTGRLQRKLNKLFGDGWVVLHHTAGFVDPLHSTGIAHSLAGVEKLVSILVNSTPGSGERTKWLEQYQTSFFKELSHIDLLVAGCYRARQYFELFTAFTMLYFVSTIHYEQQRLSGRTPDHFLSANHPELSQIIHEAFGQLQELPDDQGLVSPDDVQTFVSFIQKKIAPFNSVGLMDPSKKNMYEHTAVTL